MNLVDLRLPKKTKKELQAETISPAKQDRYPWGFRFSFDTELMNKFPQLKNAKIGEKVGIQGVGEVMEIRKVDRQGEKNQFSVEVQIQKVSIKPSAAKKNEDSLIGAIEKNKKGELK